MFDIGFFELLMIAIVGLVVIGPERLPEALRAGALWWGRVKRNLRETRADLEQQLGADEIRRELHNEEVMRSLEALRSTRNEVEREVRSADPGTEPVTSEQDPPAEADQQPESVPSPDGSQQPKETSDKGTTRDQHKQ